MPAEGVPKALHSEMLSLEQLGDTVAFLVAQAGLERVKLTGGEPLVRTGIESLIQRVAAMPGVNEVSLTSNASLLGRMAERLKAAGVQRVNISLDSLDPQRFAEVTRGGKLAEALAGIRAAQQAGLLPIKLNAVLQRSCWEQDVPRLLDFAAENDFELRFIELMRTGTEREWCASEYVPADTVLQWLERNAPVESAEGPAGAPAKLTEVNWRGRPVVVGWITPRSHPFCNRCERVRLDARGRLRRCLMDPQYLELGGLLQRMGEQRAGEEFRAYMTGKRAPAAMESFVAMSLIGG
jgi:cyclic pyranopterin phosphate synthase